MTPVGKLELRDHPWLTAEALTILLKILNSDRLNARMVGGCVRDALSGQEIGDIDLACRLSPPAAVARLKKAGIKVIPTGIKHGTITAVVNKCHFEITSLRRDTETDGRRARVSFIDDWGADAKRRDFTINALYLDADGSLYDPCGGLDDIAAGRVRFIGDADQRITEDALRILRFFRFAATIGRGKPDLAGLSACIRHRDMIDHLSGERLMQEMFKILRAENLLSVIRVMADKGILDKIIPGHKNLADFNDYVRVENKLGRCNILARLSCLVPGNQVAPAKIIHRLKLSRKQADSLTAFCRHDITITADICQKDIRKAIYLSGRDVVIFALLQAGKKLGEEPLSHWLEYAQGWQPPVFPLLGRDLINMGLTAGPELGKILKALENEWLDSDFLLTKVQLTARVPAIVTEYSRAKSDLFDPI
ncbi:MAG: CCA tRNA nucleotidyltransferase [Alphaproteobacteria bacterium]|nr:CCA tRNA nucleotidyltransferase [Alphaproteobacteria bacterium]